MEPSPDQAGVAPAERVLEPGRGRPADRAGKAGNEGDAGDRGARIAAVKPGQGRKGWVIKADRHADSEDEPGDRQADDTLRQGEPSEPGGQYHVGRREHGAPAMDVDQLADPGADRRPEQQRRREDAEKDADRQAERSRDRN